MDQETEDRLRRLEQRLARLEASLDELASRTTAASPTLAPSPPLAKLPPASTHEPWHTPPVRPPPLPVMPIAPPVQQLPPEISAELSDRHQADADTATNAIHVAPIDNPPIQTSDARPQSVASVPQTNLEQTIGLKWAGWIGAVVLVIGGGLGIKFAYDQGWFAAIPDAVKLLIMAACAFGLIGAGEWVLRKINRLSAAGLYGAGVAMLFVVGYAGFGWYGLYAREMAFVLAGFAAVVGVALAARSDLVAVAAVGMIGGYIAPVLLSTGNAAIGPFHVYLMFLQALALALCGWRATPKWWTLRSLALAATTLWQAAAAASEQSPAAVLGFAIAIAVLFHAELIFSTHRRQALSFTPSITPDDTAGGLVCTLITAAFTWITQIAISPMATPNLRAAWLGGTAIMAAAWGLSLAGRKSVRGISLSLRIQATVLAVVIVPILLDGPALVFGWLALAIAFAAIARFGNSPIARFAAVIIWPMSALALAHWCSRGPTEAIVELFQTQVPSALAVSAAVVAGAHLIGLFCGHRNFEDQRLTLPDELRIGMHVMAAITWTIASLTLLPPLGATLSLVLYTWVAYVVSFLPLGRLAAITAVAVSELALIKWVAVDLMHYRVLAGRTNTPVSALANPYTSVGGIVLATMVGVVWTRRDRLFRTVTGDGPTPRELLPSLLAAAVGIVVALGLSVEASYAIGDSGPIGVGPYSEYVALQLALTIIWGAMLASLLAFDRLIARPNATGVADLAFAALLLVVGKFLLVDLLGWRIEGAGLPVPPLANLQASLAVLLCGLMGGVYRLSPKPPRRAIAVATAAVIVFVAGSFEIDRYAIQTAGPTPQWIIRQAGLSIYWSILAVCAIATGFALRNAPTRIAGLALFGLTAVKITLIDLSGTGTGWRVLSFIGLGLLLLATSVIYGRFAPIILKQIEEREATRGNAPTTSE